jgi:hypothetical protein
LIDIFTSTYCFKNVKSDIFISNHDIYWSNMTFEYIFELDLKNQIDWYHWEPSGILTGVVKSDRCYYFDQGTISWHLSKKCLREPPGILTGVDKSDRCYYFDQGTILWHLSKRCLREPPGILTGVIKKFWQVLLFWSGSNFITPVKKMSSGTSGNFDRCYQKFWQVLLFWSGSNFITPVKNVTGNLRELVEIKG